MSKRKFLASPYIIWMIGFTILPLIMIIGYGVTDGSGTVTLSNILAIFNPIHRKALLLSLALAACSTGICLAIAFPLALVLRNLNFNKKGFITLIVILPMWMNFMLRVLAWQVILAENGILNMALGWLGIEPLHIMYTPVAVMIGMIYDYLPFMILPIYNAVSNIREDVVEAARDLGADNSVVRRKIIFPLSLPGIISGITMVFVPSLTEFVVPNILGGGKVLLIGNVIEQEFTQSMNWNLGSGLSVALMVFIIISMLFTLKNDSEDGGSLVW
ncbi:Putrescine transport system permease protein PotH [uncultured Roseburia sp.]|uniref:ABC transporter permease n=1 Tax=Brotonthovivens ammoniilytica TaxID=2981725 RepID=A0ABT2TLY4_9FIRM|nr:ABC transporter permease [Brotonthovivens ammoniilytica]MCU6763224.1 ABC transporter permease [Brotonthovivens ammoniilytica]SCJ07429.1 Putrescine transport system permease protein PotH [uncultured Roseburia sp.]